MHGSTSIYTQQGIVVVSLALGTRTQTSLAAHPHTYPISPSQYKSLGIPSLNRAYIQRALLDENVQYLLLALYWNFRVFHSLLPGQSRR